MEEGQAEQEIWGKKGTQPVQITMKELLLAEEGGRWNTNKACVEHVCAEEGYETIEGVPGVPACQAGAEEVAGINIGRQ